MSNGGEEIPCSGGPEIFNKTEALAAPCKAVKSSSVKSTFSTVKWLESIERW